MHPRLWVWFSTILPSAHRTRQKGASIRRSQMSIFAATMPIISPVAAMLQALILYQFLFDLSPSMFCVIKKAMSGIVLFISSNRVLWPLSPIQVFCLHHPIPRHYDSVLSAHSSISSPIEKSPLTSGLYAPENTSIFLHFNTASLVSGLT